MSVKIFRTPQRSCYDWPARRGANGDSCRVCVRCTTVKSGRVFYQHKKSLYTKTPKTCSSCKKRGCNSTTDHEMPCFGEVPTGLWTIWHETSHKKTSHIKHEDSVTTRSLPMRNSTSKPIQRRHGRTKKCAQAPTQAENDQRAELESACGSLVLDGFALTRCTSINLNLVVVFG